MVVIVAVVVAVDAVARQPVVEFQLLQLVVVGPAVAVESIDSVPVVVAVVEFAVAADVVVAYIAVVEFVCDGLIVVAVEKLLVVAVHVAVVAVAAVSMQFAVAVPKIEKTNQLDYLKIIPRPE